MKTIIHLDCTAGLSGDMAAGALIELLESPKPVMDALGVFRSYGMEPCLLPAGNGLVSSVRFCLSGPKETVMHRTLQDVRKLIHQAGLCTAAEECAFRIYDIIADAEAEVHQVSREQVVFHEVGSDASVADVIAASAAYTELSSEVVIPCLYEGNGSVQCAHGILPVPAPAVRTILKQQNIPWKQIKADGEILTPTGAAIAAAIRTTEAYDLNRYEIKKSGRGYGTRNTGLRGYAEAQLLLRKKEMQYE